MTAALAFYIGYPLVRMPMGNLCKLLMLDFRTADRNWIWAVLTGFGRSAKASSDEGSLLNYYLKKRKLVNIFGTPTSKGKFDKSSSIC
jgi:hypothetical protein